VKKQDIIKLSIVIPLANESETLESFYKEIIKYITPFEERFQIKIFLVMDNASKDNTREIVEFIQKQDSHVHLVWAPQNRCVVDAYIAGFKAAIDDGSDYILEMDGGGTHLPGEIPLFINKLLDGYDCVFGSRFTKNAEMDAGFKRHFYSRGGTIIAKILLGMKISDATSGFEAFKTDILKKIISKKLISTGHFYQTEIRFRAKDFNYAEVPIHYSNPVNKIPAKYIRNAFYGLMACFFERVRGVKYG